MEHVLNERIAAIIESSLVNMGYSLVQVRMMGGERRTLQIMAERTDGKNMTVEDCADISHNVSALLDVEDPISGAYTLEVSSPGIDRPLVKLSDFERFSNFEAKLESKIPIEGRKRFKGRLKGVEGEEICLQTTEGEEYRIPFRNVHSAKLLLTEELLKASG
jgi:ribosome maturation factor RimP